MTQNNKQQAVIYCRISDKGQTGLGSQEHRCRQYAEAKEYEVAAVFHDKVTGEGDFMKRQAMVELLNFLDDNPQTNFVVIFDDLRRFARDTVFHLILRDEMKKRGAIRECLNYTFDDSIEGEFSETIHAAAGQLERKVIARQNRQKKIARMEAGYFAFSRPPIGYRYTKARGSNSKVLVRDEPYASIIADVLEGFASGRYASQAEVARHLEAHPRFPKHNGKVPVQKVTRLLTQPLYAAYISSEAYGVSIRDAQHEGLISKATFQKIQDRIAGRANAPARKDLNRDFPLRGAVRCSECGNHLTASWPRGKYKSYAYYLCQKKGCSQYGKSIPRAKIEGEFETVLKSLQPSKGFIKATVAAFRIYWSTRVSQDKENAAAIKTEIARADAQIDKLVNRIVEATNDRAIGALENKIGELEQRKLVLAEQAAKTDAPQPDFNESLELPLRFLANPYNIWLSGVFELKRLVIKLVFSEPLQYARESGYRTPKTAIAFSALGGNSGSFLPDLQNGALRGIYIEHSFR
ncbi:MAG: recombinase family protein [Pseudomonadota bacterium]